MLMIAEVSEETTSDENVCVKVAERSTAADTLTDVTTYVSLTAKIKI